LAQAAGLDIGEHGDIRVNEQLQTSDHNIWQKVPQVVEMQSEAGPNRFRNTCLI